MPQLLYFVTIVIFISSCSASEVKYEGFRKNFHDALSGDFTKSELDSIYILYSSSIFPDIRTAHLSDNRDTTIVIYPLANFKNEKLYKDNIEKLINSNNQHRRILAYAVIGSSGDKTFENQLLSKLEGETDEGCLIWAVRALMYTRSAHTTPIFDVLVKYESIGDAHDFPIYVHLNADSIRQTAYLRITSKNPKAKILAAQSLAYTGLNPKTEELLKNALRTWDVNLKGYAIVPIKLLGIGDLLETLKPLLDNSEMQLRTVAFEALANSPTEKDRQYLLDLVKKQDTVSEELLNAFYKSKNIDNLRYWMTLLYSKPIPKEYYFDATDQPLFKKETLLHDIHNTLQKITAPEILSKFVLALNGRTDDVSTDLLLHLLVHENSTVRYWAGDALKGNHSEKLLSKLPELLSNSSIREVSYTKLAIDNKLDTLQKTFEDIYRTEQDLDWQRSSIEYLSTFPKQRHSEIFKEILKKKDEDFFIQHSAALGLGELKDKSSVDLLISVCRKEAETSELNTRIFLIALAKIKGDKAKKEIEKHIGSNETIISELVEDLLKKW